MEVSGDSVTVSLYAPDPQSVGAVQTELKKMGVQVLGAAGNEVDAVVPIRDLPKLSSLLDVDFVAAVTPPVFSPDPPIGTVGPAIPLIGVTLTWRTTATYRQ